MFDLKGVIPPMVTPFDAAGNVVLADFESNVDLYIEKGVTGFLVLGSNGEAVFLEHEEKLALIKAARRRVPSSMMLLAGTGVESTRGTIQLTREAADLGVDAVLVKNPFYYKPGMTHEVYVAHYLAVADASPVPVIIYNVPVFTGISVESRLVNELARHPNIRGIKESSGNTLLIQEILWGTDAGRFSLVVGAAGTLHANMVVGARGGIVALACAAPRVLQVLYEAHQRGNTARANRAQQILTPAALAVTARFGIPGLKAGMEFEGFKPGFPRQPLQPLSEPRRQELRSIFDKMNRELADLG